jgi:bifunctional aspartokinase / homoserine dehydrogenase 1
MIVHKLGGTSMGDARRIAAVAEIIRERHGQAGIPADAVVVVSAMSGVTDQLIAGARAAADGRDGTYREIRAGLLQRHLEVIEALLQRSAERLQVAGLVEDRLHEVGLFYRSIAMLGELTPRGSDAVATFGEQLAASILAAALRSGGVRAQALSATELIVTDDHYGAAVPAMGPTRERLRAQILPLLQRGVIPVVTGYVGATPEGVPTTLGRGGSDFSAAIIGAGLDADEVWIWSDVDGILTADPNIVPQARTLTELSYAEASDLAYFGADVLHPKTIRPVIERGIPLRIVNSFNPADAGTLIVRRPSAERTVLPAILSARGLSLVAVGSQDDSWALQKAAQALRRLSEAGVDVLMFSQSFSEHSLNLVVREQDQAHCLHTLSREFENGQPGGPYAYGVKERVATISVVGVPGWNGNGIVSHTFAALGKHGTRVIAVAQDASEKNVSFCVPEEQLEDTVRFLHRELGLEAPASP